MSRIGFSNFFSNDLTSGLLDSWSGGVTQEISIIRNSQASAKCNSGVGNVVSIVNFSATSTVPNTSGTYTFYVRVYFYFANYPSTTSAIIQNIMVGETAPNVCVQIDSTGHLIARVGGGSTSSASASTVPLNEWHRIEAKFVYTIVANTSRAESLSEVLLDGTNLSLSATRTILTATPNGSFRPNFGWSEAPGANLVCYVSDWAFNDDTTANQNSYPGSGKVALLVPISTNGSPAAKWTGNSGTQTNMWDAVNNLPPRGIAAGVTPPDAYIKHAGGAAGTTDSFDANMTTYQTAGVASGDTINVIQFVDIDGEEATTGTKLLNFEILSNPVIASPGNVTAGDDAGAQGSYPITWARHRSAMSYVPSVTVATSPVMRARRPETATRVASVCFMGMYVDYTPAATSSPKRMRAAVLGM